jgi:hypothetical protein
MSNATPPEATGILTPTDRQFLCGELADDEGISAARRYQRIRSRLAAAMVDVEALYCGLRDEDIQAVFDDESEGVAAAPFHTALVFLFYSMLQTNRQPEIYIERALRHAYAAMDQHASTRVDIVTEPFLPPQQRLAAVAADGISRVSMDALERLYYDESLPPEAFENVGEGHELLPSAEEIRQMRADVTPLERVPLSVVLDVDVNPLDEENGRENQ